ncbi:hypothetical protein N9N28_10050 [Rubripirellula amarantea]|nr:hypothetical protein [Rubripirellula amarantea]
MSSPFFIEFLLPGFRLAGMTIELSEFWTRLVRTGITHAQGCQAIAQRFREANGGSPPREVEQVTQFLLSTGELTPFQRDCVLANPPTSLAVGSFVIRDPKAPVPFQSFASARWLNAPKESLRDGILLRTGPGNEWLDRHAAIQADSLQRYQTEMVGEYVAVFSPLPKGRLLRDHLVESSHVGRRFAVHLGKQIATALSVLHEHSLYHGAVRLDRVWVTDDEKAILLRDPSGPGSIEASDVVEASGGWFRQLEPQEHYLAPECLAAVTQSQSFSSNVRTDLYSLGCLLYRIATGAPTLDGGDAAATFHRHQTEMPSEVSTAIEAGEAGDPFFRVLAYALAKDPQARFADVEQFANALDVVEGLIESDSSGDTGKVEQRPVKPHPAKRHSNDKPEKKSGRSKDGAKKQVAATGLVTTKKPTTRTPIAKVPVAKAPSKRDSATGGSATSDSATKDPTTKKPNSKNPTPAKPTPRERSDSKAENRAKTPIEPARNSDKQSGVDVDAELVAADHVDDRLQEKSSSHASSGQHDSESEPVETDAPVVVESAIAQAPTTKPDSAQPQPSSNEPSREPQDEPDDQSVGKAVVESSTSPAPLRSARPRRPKRRNLAPWVLAGLAGIVVFQVAYLAIVDPVQPVIRQARTRPPLPDVIPSVSSRSAAITKAKAASTSDPNIDREDERPASFQVVKDERLLYVPPYEWDSEPAPLDMLPPGPAMIVSVNLSDAQNGEDFISTVQGTIPELADLLRQAVERVQIPADRLARIAAAFHPGLAGVPEVTLSVTLTEAVPASELMKRFGVSEARTRAGMKIHVGDDEGSDAYYFDVGQTEGATDGNTNDSSVKRFALGSIEQITQVAAIEGQTIPLPRSLRSLWRATRESCDVCVLMNSNFLFADGRELLAKSMPELSKPLRRLLIPNTSAALVMVDVVRNDDSKPQLYAEWRLAASGSITEASLSRTMQDSINGWPDWADRFISTTEFGESWSLLAQQLPAMLKFVAQQARVGVADRTATANIYLPQPAVSQLSLATLLAMNTPQGQKLSANETTAMAKALSIDEILASPLSVSFGQESLEAAMELVADSIASGLPDGAVPTIQIMGGDLQKMGITQNQSIRDFKKENVPLRTILTDLVVLANPDKSSTGPADERQALIWVVEKASETSDSSSGDRILITTRQAARDRYEVPKEFVAP